MGKATVYQYMILDTKRVELRKARPGRDQPLVGGLQARRRNPVIYLCVGLEQLNFPKKFISLWTRRHAVSFTRALLHHTLIINLFHVVSPRKQRPHFSERVSAEGDGPAIFNANRK
jgi:hypothetical protein